MTLTFKLPALIILLLVVFALVEAMYYLTKDHGDKNKTRVVQALSKRVTLALILFILLIGGAFFGIISPS